MNSKRSSLWKLALLATACLHPIAARADVLTTYYLDFGNLFTPNVYQTGYTPILANQLADTMISATGITGSGSASLINFSFDHVGAFTGGGDTTQPITASGFYTFGNETFTHGFSISGLQAGDEVTLYALSAWDGNGRAGVISFGGSFTQALTIGTPGLAPDLSNFSLINFTPVVADGTGIVSGTLLGADGTATQEGQVGAFIVQVNSPAPVPEPATVAFLFTAGVGFLVLRRRRLVLGRVYRG